MSRYRVQLTLAGDDASALARALRRAADLPPARAEEVVRERGVVAEDLEERDAKRIAGRLEMAGGQAMLLPQGEFELEEGLPLKIQLVDGDDEPVAGAEVRVRTRSEGFDREMEPARTDERGRADFPGFSTAVRRAFDELPPVWFRVTVDGEAWEVDHSAFQWTGFQRFPDTVHVVVAEAPAGDGPPDRPRRGRRTVRGTVTGPDGEPTAGVTVRAYDRDLRTEEPLGEPGVTDEEGAYEIEYSAGELARAEKGTADLRLRVRDEAGRELEARPVGRELDTVFNASAMEAVDLRIAEGEAGPSLWEELRTEVGPLLGELGWDDLGAEDLAFLHHETGRELELLGFAADDARLAARTGVPEAVFFGLATRGVGTVEDPERGAPRIDLPTALDRPVDALLEALEAAAGDGAVPPRLVGRELGAVRAALERRKEATTSESPLKRAERAREAGRLAGLDEAAREAVAARLAGPAGGDDAWTGLVEDGVVDEEQAAEFRTTLSMTVLAGDHVPLVEALRTADLPRLGGPARSTGDLAALRPSDWQTILEEREIEPPGELSAEGYARRLAERVERQHPTAVFAHRTVRADHAAALERIDDTQGLLEDNEALFEGLASGRISLDDVDFGGRSDDARDALAEDLREVGRLARTFRHLGAAETLDRADLSPSEKASRIRGQVDAMDAFFEANAGLDLRRADFFGLARAPGGAEVTLDAVEEEMRPRVRKQAMAFQRAMGLAPDAEGARALLAEGLDSAGRIQARSPATLARETGLSEEAAAGVYHRAREVTLEARRLGSALAREHPSLRVEPSVLASPDRLDTELREIDGYEDLFGPQDYCSCRHCASIFGPVAYFVDLMRFVGKHVLAPTFADDDDPLHLRARRPDLWEQELTCEAATELIPTLTVINEILERYVAGDTADDDTVEARAEAAYDLLRGADHSFRLPFHRPLVELRVYLGHFGLELAGIVEAVHGWGERAARESLELSPGGADRVVLPETSEAELRRLYGLDAGASLDPMQVRDVLRASGLGRDELTRVVPLDVLNRGGPPMRIEREPEPGSPNAFTETLHGLSAERLDRLHRFVRLLDALPWTPEALAHVLEAEAPALLDPSADEAERRSALETVSGLREVQARLEVKADVAAALVGPVPDAPYGPEGRSLFDRLFNPQRLAPDAPEAWSPGDLPTFRHPVFAAPGDAGDVALDPAHYRLQGAVGVDESTFEELLGTLFGDEADPSTAELPLTHERLSRLYRHARLLELLETGADQLFSALRVVQGREDAEVGTLEQLRALLRFLEWQAAGPLSVETVASLARGGGAGWTDGEIREALAGAAETAAAITFPLEALLSPPQVTASEGDVLVDVLVDGGVLEEVPAGGDGGGEGRARYRVTDAFDPGASLPLSFGDPVLDDEHAEALATLRDHEREIRDRLSGHLPDRAGVESLASAFDVPAELFRAVFALTDLDAGDRQDRLLLVTPVPDGDPVPSRVSGFFGDTARALRWIRPLGLDPGDVRFVADHPDRLALAPGAAPSLGALRRLARYADLSSRAEDADLLHDLLLADGTDAGLLGRYLDVSEAHARSFVDHLPLPATGAGGPAPEDAVPRLAKVVSCVELASTLGVDGGTLRRMASEEMATLREARKAALAAFRSMHQDAESFEEAFGPYQDRIRERRRDALVDFIVTHPDLDFGNARDVYHHFLIDPELEGCARTSRIVAATGSLQLYVHRCLMGLEADEDGDVRVDPPPEMRREWEWRKNYRVWEANRKVFVYPENFLEPDLRDNKTPLFEELEDTLLQQEITPGTVEQAYRAYLEGLEDVAGLTIRGACWDEAEETFHFFGTTNKEDSRFFTRTATYLGESAGWDGGVYDSKRPMEWSPWEEVDLKIRAPVATPYFYRDRLHLFWVEARPRQETSVSGGDVEDQGEEHEILLKVAYRTQDDAWSDVQEIRLTTEDDYLEDVGTPLGLIWNKVYPYERDGALHVVYRSGSGPEGGEHFELDLFSGEAWRAPDGSPDSAPAQFAHVDLATRLEDDGELAYRLQYSLDDYADDFAVDNSFEPWEDAGVALTEARAAGPVALGFRRSQGAVSLVGDLEDLGWRQWMWDYMTDRLPWIGHDVLSHLEPAAVLAVHGAPGHYLLQAGRQLYFLEFNAHLVLLFPVPYWRAWPLTSGVADDLGRILMRRGPDGLLAADTESDVDEAPFPLEPTAEGLIERPHQVEDRLDFSGPYGVYYREIFLHIPLLLADHLNAAGEFDAARDWYHYVFDPTTDEEPPSRREVEEEGVRPTAHYWKYPEFREPPARTAEEILEDAEAIARYRRDPFSPHAVARARLTAYQKSVVMRYVDNLLDWGDELFARDTRESINEATLLYTMAADILGPRPAELGACETVEERIAPATYEELEIEGEFDVAVENLAVAARARMRTRSGPSGDGAAPAGDGGGPAYAAALRGVGSGGITGPGSRNRIGDVDLYGTGADPGLARLRRELEEGLAGVSVQPGTSEAFCVPVNEELLGYWDRVEDRLFKIRNCMNISGERRSLALFQPPIDPGLLARARAAGLSLGEALELAEPDVPVYRFQVLLERAKSYASTVRSFGGALQSALEKKDAEELRRLKATHRQNLLKLTTEVKERRIEAAKRNLEAVRATRDRTRFRKQHYADLLDRGLSGYETANLAFMTTAQLFENYSNTFNTAGSIAHAVPNVGAPTAMTYGGREIGAVLTAVGSAFANDADRSRFGASMSSTLGDYERRSERWTFQRDVADRKLDELEKQILAAEVRVAVAERELEIHERTMEQADEVFEFYEDEFTSLGLYTWLSTELQRLYREAYDMAHEMAVMAQRAYRYEKDDDTVFVEPGHWESQRAGLLAGERLQLQLRRMEKAHLENNRRTFEISQTFSLAQMDPFALEELQNGGSCRFRIPEVLFDVAYPGQVRRRIRSVRITIPCVTGPYVNVNAKLRLLQSWVREEPETGEEHLVAEPRARNASIATSSAQNDSGQFQLSFQDGRYVPFESAGAVSEWALEMPDRFRSFDYDSITDVLIHLDYSAREGGERFRGDVVDSIQARLEAVARDVGFSTLVSLREEGQGALQTLLRPGADGGSAGAVRVGPERFPYFLDGETLQLTTGVVVLRLRESWDAHYTDASGSEAGPLEVSLRAGEGSDAREAAATLRRGGGLDAFDGVPHATFDLTGGGSSGLPLPDGGRRLEVSVASSALGQLLDDLRSAAGVDEEETGPDAEMIRDVVEDVVVGVVARELDGS